MKTSVLYPAKRSLQEKICITIEYWTSWHTLSRLTSEKLYKTGLFSVFLVPLLASLYLAIASALTPIIHLLSYNFPRQSLFLFFSGIAVIVANIVYSIRCPIIVKEHLQRDRYERYRPWPIYYLRDELLHALRARLSRVDFTVSDVEWLATRQERQFHTMAEMLQAGYSCTVIGYAAGDVYAIEDLLLRTSSASGVDLYIRYFQDREYRLADRFSQLFPPAPRMLLRFEFSPVRPSGATVGTEDSFFLEWKYVDCTDPSIDPLEGVAMGAHLIVNPRNATALREVLAEWLTLSRRGSRWICFAFFGLSLILLGVFLYYQITAVIRVI